MHGFHFATTKMQIFEVAGAPQSGAQLILKGLMEFQIELPSLCCVRVKMVASRLSLALLVLRGRVDDAVCQCYCGLVNVDIALDSV